MSTSRERPVVPMRRNFGNLTGRSILHFYIVCDESSSLEEIGGVEALNQALPDLHATIASDPLLSGKFFLGLITFAESAVELMQITDLGEVVSMPGIKARGDRMFGPVFKLLHKVIERDFKSLKSSGAEVFRPAVFFITVGEPNDALEWEEAYRTLTDQSKFRHYPNLIAFGVHEAQAETIGKIGTVGAFMGNGVVTPADALAEAMPALCRSSPPHLWTGHSNFCDS